MTPRRLGFARRIRVRTPFGCQHEAWDCRPFGFGRILAPILPTRIELAQGTELDLTTGELSTAVESDTADNRWSA